MSLFVLALLSPGNANAASLSGKVINVADGDTIVVLAKHRRHRIRLAGIDAPEHNQPYGKLSGRALRSLIGGKHVRVDYDKRDRYGRIVGVVWVQALDSSCAGVHCLKKFDAGLHQVSSGMAWWYRRYAHEQTPQQRAQYEHAQTQAKERRIGLWQASRPAAPWQWRRQRGR